MSIAIRLLNRSKEITGSDIGTAKELQICQSTLSKVRSGSCPLRPYHAARMAELIGKHWFVGVLQTLIERSESSAEATYWRQHFEDLKQRHRTRWRESNEASELPAGAGELNPLGASANALQLAIRKLGYREARARTNKNHWRKLTRQLRVRGIDPVKIGNEVAS